MKFGGARVDPQAAHKKTRLASRRMATSPPAGRRGKDDVPSEIDEKGSYDDDSHEFAVQDDRLHGFSPFIGWRMMFPRAGQERGAIYV